MNESKQTIFFFKSALCPRCMLVGRELDKLLKQYPNLKIEAIDVTLHPLIALQNNIRMIPALKAGDQTLAGLFLRAGQLRNFVEKISGT